MTRCGARARALAVVVATVAFGFAGCGGDDGDEVPSVAEDETTTTLDPELLDIPGPVNEHGTASLGESERLGIELDDVYFAPTYVEMPQAALGRTVQVLLNNAGSLRHTFTVEEFGIDVELAPGEERMIDVEMRDIPAVYVCRFHAGQGMKGAFSFQGS